MEKEARTLRLINCRLAQHAGDGDTRLWDVTVNKSIGIIESIDPSTFLEDSLEKSSPSEKLRTEVVNCEGHYLSPGYIDIQLNGGEL